ncbi:phosphoribosylamine--glycine ligase [Tindallia californiensis]|uniref:Phosphoribosylamine--glycine ligase n=1 Tax=Tindallia californiensis TaxID=159292 RepID=A0A1H3L6Q5_9FIRM|nr:phosphoribosylamine--glycine ligase [Tindallia californiensis]SDY59614.1 phosphoribosylamine--glycine ligase [Tindallia californiensis]
MKILVIGGGGREHTLVWKLKQSSVVEHIYCAPGNPGINEIAEGIAIQVENIEGLKDFALEKQIDLTVVGPEVPLVEGVVDAFREAGLQIVGPDQAGARLEGSKSFAKAFMEKYDIPTGKYEVASHSEEAKEKLEAFEYPLVIKADGLAAGKGVLICQTKKEAMDAIEDILEKKVFGQAGNHLVLEEFLVGTETSMLCFVDGESILPMASSQDHKQIGDHDTGPNTGGMGTYSPNRAYTVSMEKEVEQKILRPTLEGIRAEGMDFRGILFIGLMITKDGPKVLEYNVRFGDPETQVVLPRLKNDLCVVFQHLVNKRLKEVQLEWKEETAVCIVLASEGYPADYKKGIPIHGIDEIREEVLIFHAGTTIRNNELVTNGGRVLGVTALGQGVDEAREKAYAAVDVIQYKGKTYRKDIGLR